MARHFLFTFVVLFAAAAPLRAQEGVIWAWNVTQDALWPVECATSNFAGSGANTRWAFQLTNQGGRQLLGDQGGVFTAALNATEPYSYYADYDYGLRLDGTPDVPDPGLRLPPANRGTFDGGLTPTPVPDRVFAPDRTLDVNVTEPDLPGLAPVRATRPDAPPPT